MGVVSNKIKREELKAGDHIYSWRPAYISAHHGIYAGEGKVIHFTQGTSKEPGTGNVTSAPSYPLGIPCPNCGYMSKQCRNCGYMSTHGVISSCIDCFLSRGNLYRFEYSVSVPCFFIQARGGTCTLAHSDPPEDVLRRSFFLLQNSFGGYNIFRNNCEDFAIYCKTGLLVIPGTGEKCSKQVPSFDSFLDAVKAASTISEALKILTAFDSFLDVGQADSTISKALKNFTGFLKALSWSGASAVVLKVVRYQLDRLASDIEVRKDVAKVPLERLVLEFGFGNSDLEGGSEIGTTDSSVAESGSTNSDPEIAIGGSANFKFRCFVRGLACTTTERALTEAFSQFGKILELKIINHRVTGRSMGFGFVTFSDEKSMRDAIEGMNGQNIDSCNITVSEVQSRRRKRNISYNRDGGGRHEGGYRRGGGRHDNRGGGSYRKSSRGGYHGGGYGRGRDCGYDGSRYSRGGGGGASDCEGSYNRGEDGGGYGRSSRGGYYGGGCGGRRDRGFDDGGSRNSRGGGGSGREGGYNCGGGDYGGRNRGGGYGGSYDGRCNRGYDDGKSRYLRDDGGGGRREGSYNCGGSGRYGRSRKRGGYSGRRDHEYSDDRSGY